MGQPQRTLAGQRVLVTRPSHQAEPLCQALAAAGAEPIRFPTLAIEAAEAYCDNLQPLKHCFLELDRYDVVIFVSANAARLGYDWIDQYWPQLPVGILWLAVGNATAQALIERNIPARLANTGMDSESLLTLPQLQQLAGQRVLICRGQGGREFLGDTLLTRGAQVDYAELYRRICPDYTEQDVESIIYKSLPSVILVNSNESLDNLDRLSRGVSGKLPIKQLRQQLLIVPSARVADNAMQLGYTRVRTAANATDQAMLEAIQLS